MPRKSKERRLAEIHTLALQQFEDSYNATKTDRQWALMARKFVNIRGEQWSWDANDQFRNKIKLEVDLVSNACMRIKNEYRKNRISAAFVPADGTEADALADACAARFRADTQNIRGREARAVAFDHALEGGFGGYRLRAEMETGSKERQRICLEAVPDAESCLFFDVNAKHKDKSDAGHAFLITPWSKRAFVEEYGEQAATWPAGLPSTIKFPWIGAELVFVAEYFVKEEGEETWRVFKGFNDEEREFPEDEIDDAEIADLLAQGFVEQEPRVEEVDRVVKYVLSGGKVLQGPETLPGRCIPLVPQYGQRTVIEHVERFRGHPLKVVDAQIVYNLQISKVAETAASSGIEKPIFLTEQIARYETMWQNDHIDNNAFLLIDPVTDVNGSPQPAGPVGYTKAPQLAPAVAALVDLTRQDISDQLGNPENAEQLQPDQSGVALDLVQGRIDMQSYGYMEEAADAERRIAEIWLSMAADVYVEEGRKLKTISEDGKPGSIEIGKKVQDPKTGAPVAEIDFSRAAFDVVSDIGPTSASRRAAIVRSITGLIGVTPDPEMQTVLGHVALMNMEGEGLQDVRDYSRRKLLNMGIIKPTKEEAVEMQAAQAANPPQPDPQAIVAEAVAQESLAKADKAKADTGKAIADTELAKAKTAETLAGIPIAQQEAAVKTAQAIMAEGAPADAGPTQFGQ